MLTLQQQKTKTEKGKSLEDRFQSTPPLTNNKYCKS